MRKLEKLLHTIKKVPKNIQDIFLLQFVNSFNWLDPDPGAGSESTTLDPDPGAGSESNTLSVRHS